MAQHAVTFKGVSVRQACQIFAISECCYRYKPVLHRGKTQQNAYIERPNRTVRYDWLGQHLLSSLNELQEYATKWQYFYNNQRPNMALNGFTPRQYIQRMA